MELFVISCSACSHDFDKGLLSGKDIKVDHGKGSGAYLLDNYKQLQRNHAHIVNHLVWYRTHKYEISFQIYLNNSFHW